MNIELHNAETELDAVKANRDAWQAEANKGLIELERLRAKERHLERAYEIWNEAYFIGDADRVLNLTRMHDLLGMEDGACDWPDDAFLGKDLPDLPATEAQALADAMVAVEREQCALLCETFEQQHEEIARVGSDFAAAIRSRSA